VVPAGVPVVFVIGAGQDVGDLVRQARNVGYETLLGALAGGIDGWRAAGHETATVPLVDAASTSGVVVDVRQRAEFADGRIPGARNVELGVIDETDPPPGPLAVMCSHGERAMTGASLLVRRGRRDVRSVVGGPDDWAAQHGPLEHGP
jgi:rhodanese-related sulfurtransferase